MSKLSAVTAVVLAFLVVPALAAAAPTATQITTPAGTTYLTGDWDQPAPYDLAGTTTGDGDVDIRCYWGDTSAKIAGPIPVTDGEFRAAFALDYTTLQTLGNPHPFCTLRAVPAGTTPAAPPGSPSEWAGPAIGVGAHRAFQLGPNTGQNDPTQMWDYWIAQSQPRAENDYDGAASCGLCDTFLFSPETKAVSNAIWYSNSALMAWPYKVDDRTAVEIDAKPAFAGASAYYPGSLDLHGIPGFPKFSYSYTVDASTGDLTIEEHERWVRCSPEPATWTPTETSCTTYVDTGVQLDRLIKQTDSGLRVAIVDRWKSTDNQSHTLDALYEDWEHSQNAMMSAEHAGRANFTWTGEGFKPYHATTEIPAPQSTPATLLVKTDASTPDAGDDKNPFGAMVYGSKPSELTIGGVGDIADTSGYWHPRYERTIPAGGEVVIGMAYVHDFSLDSVQAKAQAVQPYLAALMAPPAPPVPADAPSDPAPPPAPSSDAPTPPAAIPPAAVQPKVVRCIVPKLRGKTVSAAKRLLKRAHCALGKVVRKQSAKVKAGRVIATRLKAGSRQPAGTRIRVTVARKL